MAEATKTYFATSIFVSKTFWFNALAILVTILQSQEIISVLPAAFVANAPAIISLANIFLRLYTVRPSAIIAPGNTKAVSVRSISLNGVQ